MTEAGAEVDLVAVVEGRVDLAAVEVGVQQTGAGCGFVCPEVVRVAEVGKDDLTAVREVRQEFAGRVLSCGGVAKSRLPPISSVSMGVLERGGRVTRPERLNPTSPPASSPHRPAMGLRELPARFICPRSHLPVSLAARRHRAPANQG